MNILGGLSQYAASAPEALWTFAGSLFGRHILWGAVLAAVGILGYFLPPRWKTWWLAAASLALIDVFTNRALTAGFLAYCLVLYGARRLPPGAVRTALLGALLVLFAVAPIVLLSTGDPYPLQVRQFVAFATNVAWLRFYAFAVQGPPAAAPGLGSYLLSMTFFPTVMNGPIETPQQMASRRDPAYWTWPPSMAGLRAFLSVAPRAVGRIAWGVAKFVLADALLGNRNLEIFRTGGAAVGTWRLWLWVPELYFQFYLAFSGWADFSIGLGRLCGARVGENFDRPYLARNVAEFWNRWHISFGVWLRDFVYIPLGGKRHHMTLNILAVFLVSALWHVWGGIKIMGGPAHYPPVAWLGFLVWGAMNAVGVIAAKWAGSRIKAMGDRVPSLPCALTFVFVSLAWIPFFLPPWDDLGSCLAIARRLVGAG